MLMAALCWPLLLLLSVLLMAVLHLLLNTPVEHVPFSLVTHLPPLVHVGGYRHGLQRRLPPCGSTGNVCVPFPRLAFFLSWHLLAFLALRWSADVQTVCILELHCWYGHHSGLYPCRTCDDSWGGGFVRRTEVGGVAQHSKEALSSFALSGNNQCNVNSDTTTSQTIALNKWSSKAQHPANSTSALM